MKTPLHSLVHQGQEVLLLPLLLGHRHLRDDPLQVPPPPPTLQVYLQSLAVCFPDYLFFCLLLPGLPVKQTQSEGFLREVSLRSYQLCQQVELLPGQVSAPLLPAPPPSTPPLLAAASAATSAPGLATLARFT